MKDFKIYITIGSVLLIIYLIIQYNKPAPVNWQSTLASADKIPFGTYVLRKQLNDIFPDAKVSNTNQSVYNFFRRQIKPGNYIIAAKSVNISKADFEQMVKYIKAGNNIFITAFSWNGAIANKLKLSTAIEDDAAKTAINFANKKLRQSHYYKFDKDISAQYFDSYDTARATIISFNKAGKANYLRYRFGEGSLLLCANPELFTNYSLLTSQGADYASKALSYLPAHDNIYWDQYQNHDIEIDGSPLRVFFKSPALQWAYYLSLFGLTLFVLFEIKRRQRVIPIITPLKNTTVDFVEVVGKVYYEKRDNLNIAHKKILYLLSFLREQYQLKTTSLDNEFIESVAWKTGADTAFVQDLVGYINYIAQQSNVTDKELIELNHLIEKFYQKI
nr:DUF4350 domain-containing protein [uncultured Mucilaginibacter sp.]